MSDDSHENPPENTESDPEFQKVVNHFLTSPPRHQDEDKKGGEGRRTKCEDGDPEGAKPSKAQHRKPR